MARKRKGRANGHGTLEKTPGGIYIARWTAHGKRYSKSTRTGDEREAARRLEEYTAPYRLETEKRTLETIATRIEGKSAEIRRWHDQQPALAVADAYTEYSTCGLVANAEKATTHYASYYNRLAKWIRENRAEILEVRQFTQADALAFAAYLKPLVQAGTFNKHITFFRRLWKVLDEADEGKDDPPRRGEKPKAKLSGNPWQRVPNIEDEQHVRRELTMDELTRVCHSVTGEMRLLFAIGIYTGLRLGDCARLDWGNVDLRRGRISIVPHKTKRHANGRPTIIPLHSTLAAMLAAIPTNERAGFVLPETAETFIRDATIISRKIQKVFTDNGIKTQSGTKTAGGRAQVDVGFHSLRHTFVSLSANAGAPLAIVQAIVGHSNPAMTRHYFHESEKALADAVTALPDVTREKTRADGEEAAEERFRAFRAMVDGMTADERRKAFDYLAAAKCRS